MYIKINTKLFISSCSLFLYSLLALSTYAAAAADTACPASNKPSSQNHIDCVYDWGPWAFNIQPAASGVRAAVTPLLPHHARVTLRTNSIAALAPVDHTPTPFTPTIIAPPAATPPLPVTPPPAPHVGPSSGTGYISGTGGL